MGQTDLSDNLPQDDSQLVRYDDIRWTRIGPKSPRRDLESPGALVNRLKEGGRVASFLQHAARANEGVLLVVNDGHRATPTRRVLEAMAAVASDLETPPAFRVLVAAGTHKADAPERRGFEESTFHSCGLTVTGIDWHESGNHRQLVPLAGVKMNRLLAEHRFMIPIGSAEPHYFAGVTGAHKTVTIGCLSRDAIERNHAGAMNPESDLMRLDGNPVYDDIAQLLARLRAEDRRVLAINTVVDGTRILDAAVGTPITALRKLLPAVTHAFVHSVSSPVDVAHLLVPMPLGRSLYQADKALKNCHRAVRIGGGILLEAPCLDGVGDTAFLRLLRKTQDYEAARKIVDREGYRLGDHKAVKLLYMTDPKQRGLSIAAVSPNLREEELKGSGITAFRDRNAALHWLAGRLNGPRATGLRIEDAGVVGVMAGRGLVRGHN